MEVGQRVVRGEHWKWSDQDGGEGSVGTVVVIGRPGSLSSPDKTVIVQWDGGARTNYRCGHENAYDLYLLDNGPSGVMHSNVSCSECNDEEVNGLLWQCAHCNSFNLCSTCYNNNKHTLEHQFYRIDTPTSIPVLVSKRQGRQRIRSLGTFTGAVVTRGPDWGWGNQDGGPRQKGLVTDVKGWDNQTYRSVVSVTWANSEGNVYRRGHKGKIDVIASTPSEGEWYYKDHLPMLGYPFPVCENIQNLPTTTPFTPEHWFENGDKVRILVDVDVLKTLQVKYGGWDERMKSVIGVVGTVHSKSARFNNGIVVKFSSPQSKLVINPLALSKVETFQAKDSVCILDNTDLVKRLQASHGEWTDSMKHILGKVGEVQKVYSDGDVRVLVGKTSWTLNPAVLTKKAPSGRQPQPTPYPTSPSMDHALTSLPSNFGELKLSDNDATTELIQAAGQGLCTKVKDIIAAYPSKVDVKSQGKTALHMSSHGGHVDIVNLLLDSGASKNIQDNDGDTALHYAAFGNKPKIAVALIQHGSELNMTNKKTYTALHISVNKGYCSMVKTLINAGCNVNIQDTSGDTALHDAITNDRQDVITLLINSNRCDLKLVNQQGFNVFHRAALKGRQEALAALLQTSPDLLNSAKDDGFTALHLASLNGHLDCVKYLLTQSGCDINTINNKSQTPLLLAVDKTHQEVVKTLLYNGANPDIQDDVGDTPLHTAAANHYFHDNKEENAEGNIIRLLIEYGADPTLCNHDNKTASDLCHGTEMESWIKAAASSSSKQLSIPPKASVSMETTNGCRLCGNPIDCEFCPCGHRVVCYGCSNMFKACCDCKASIEIVKKLDEVDQRECKVCSEVEANVIFEPCLHMIVCSECSVRMKKCFVCQETIHTKKTTDGTIINQEPDKYGQNMDSLCYLQAKVQEMEEAQICVICMENKRNIVFLCGHSTCSVCCESLRDCPMCRKPIEKKIPLYN